jgi:hypothetical protein
LRERAAAARWDELRTWYAEKRSARTLERALEEAERLEQKAIRTGLIHLLCH